MSSKSYKAPSASASSSASDTYEYDGMDDLLRKRDEASAIDSQKQAALYKGDLAGSLSAGSRIRGLMDAIAAYESGQFPLSRIRSRSRSTSMDIDGPQVAESEDPPPYSMSTKKREDQEKV